MTRQTMLLLISVASARGLSAQAATGPRLGLTNLAAVQTDVSRPPRASGRQVSPNNWERGAVIGGLIGTAVGILFYNAFERETHGTIYVVVWAFGGAMIGGLIGSASHRT
jgi:hypothetical protein